MAVNFTPSFANYTGQDKFRFWCQSVLPLVYDDSLSYMELLNKMVIYLNRTIQDVAAVETNVDALLAAYNQLQTYVNDYFANLDVQDEINIKLDGLVEDGTMSELIQPFIDAGLPGLVETNLPGVVEEQIPGVVADQLDDVVEEQIGAVVATQIPGEVTDWLNENVDPVGSAVIVDNTLTISGAAADAKVTGDKITENKKTLVASTGNEIINMTNNAYYDLSGNNITIGTPTANSSKKYAIVECTEGDKFTISGTGGPTAQPWGFIDSDGNILSKTNNSSNITLNNVVLTAPANSAFLIVNNDKASALSSYYGELVVERFKKVEAKNNEIDSIINDTIFDVGNTAPPIEWEQGGLYNSSGGKLSDENAIRTTAFSKNNIYSIYPLDGYRIALFAYNKSDSSYIGIWNGTSFDRDSHYTTGNIIINDFEDIYLFKIVLRKVIQESVNTSEYVNVMIRSENYVKTDAYDFDKIDQTYNMTLNLQSGFLPTLQMRIGNIGSTGKPVTSSTVCYTSAAVKFDVDTFIRCKNSDYEFTIRRYSAAAINSENFIDYLGVFRGTYKLDAGTYYAITIGKRTQETVTDANEYANQIEVWSPFYLETMKKYEIDKFAPFGSTRRKIYAHKGITLSQPENTVPSFEAAGAGGAWAIETDVQATSDGYLICMHDMTVDRTTDGTGTIADMTFAEIEALRIKNYPDLQVPTIEEYLSICKIYGCVPCMELKNVASRQDMITKLINTIVDYGFESTAIILCSRYSIGYVQCINPKIRTIFIIDPTNLSSQISMVKRYFNTSVTMASGSYTITQDIIKTLHEAGLTVNVGGVNTIEGIKNYFSMGADSVSSDFIASY